jgi:hypothetical protein
VGHFPDENLDSDGPEKGCSLLKFWEAAADANPRWWNFAKTVWILLQISASESAAEGGFSIFQALGPQCRGSAREKLMEAGLRIRLDRVCNQDIDRQTKARAEAKKQNVNTSVCVKDVFTFRCVHTSFFSFFSFFVCEHILFQM